MTLGAAATWVQGCASSPAARALSDAASARRNAATADGTGAREIRGPVALWSFFDLPDGDSRSRELSGASWDPKRNVLWVVQDESPRIVELVPNSELQSWSFGETLPLEIDGPVDLEGLVVLPDGFIVCSEDGPRVIEVDRRGRFRREHPIPDRFRAARSNASLESLTLSPSGTYLFTTTEAALSSDGKTATIHAGTRVRILRIHTKTGAISEHAYMTDPLPFEDGDWGVADLAALGDDAVLVLERGWAKGHGNTARIYHVSLDESASCSTIDELPSGMPTLAKRRIADLGQIDVGASGLPTPKQPQQSPLLDNYEGITVGPRLRDGRRTLLVVSDDNGRECQVARIVVLAL